MKRSPHLRLSLMAAALPFAAGGCDNPAINGAQADWGEPPPAECATEAGMRSEACLGALDRALAGAPRYPSKGDCDTAENADCVPLDDGTTRAWIPPLAGFVGGMLFAEVIDEIGDAYRKGHRRPYRAYHGASRYPAGSTVARGDTRSRSGFGTSSGRSYGWGG